MGGEIFTVSYCLAFNGYHVDKISILPDLGANGFAFLDTRCTTDIAKFCGIQPQRLEREIYTKGYDGRQSTSIQFYIIVHLLLDNRELFNIPFLILDLDNYNIILSIK